MSDLEAALAAHLNGKFFWEHTEMLDEGSAPAEVVAIRQAQKKFAKGAKHITARNKGLGNLNSGKALSRTLKGEQEMLEPLIKAVCEAYDVSPDDLMSHKRMWNITKARKHFYWAIFRYFPSVSLLQAGRLVGKNHTTVLHGRQSFEDNYNIEMVGVVDKLMGFE